jgi:hypothetical protein
MDGNMECGYCKSLAQDTKDMREEVDRLFGLPLGTVTPEQILDSKRVAYTADWLNRSTRNLSALREKVSVLLNNILDGHNKDCHSCTLSEIKSFLVAMKEDM